MDQDYRLPKLEAFINEILNPVYTNSTNLTQRYRRLHAVIYYFEYAVGMVQSQEIALKDKKSDAIVCGNAIAAYIFIYNCFILLESAITGISKNRKLSNDIKIVKRSYKLTKDRIEKIRHSIGAHPEGIKLGTEIATKRSMICTDGRVRIGKFILHPRKDIEELRKNLERIGGLLYKDWSP